MLQMVRTRLEDEQREASRSTTPIATCSPASCCNEGGIDVEIYCVKCKVKTATRDLVETTMKNGRAAVKGVCCDCGTRKFRIGSLPTGAGEPS